MFIIYYRCENVKQFKNLIGISQEVLAEKSGITYQYLGKIERGVAKPSIEVINNIALALNIDVCDLFSNNQKNDENIIEQKLISRFNYLSKGQQDLLFEYINTLKGFSIKKDYNK